MGCPMSGFDNDQDDKDEDRQVQGALVVKRCRYCKGEIIADTSYHPKDGSSCWPSECPHCHRSFKGRSHYEKRDKKAIRERKSDHSLGKREGS